jgi:uncharacterized membrane protein YkvA (DUF1232 family)
MNPRWQQLRCWARTVKRDVHAVYLASHDPRVPWYAKVAAILVAAYALSPIDLIPDFVPVLGYVDDLLILPLGIMLVAALVPTRIMAEHRAAAERAGRLPVSRTAAATIVGLWIVAFVLVIRWALRALQSTA